MMAWIDNRRKALAAWVHPRTARKAVLYEKVLGDVRDLEVTFAKEVPEVSQAANWLMGRDWVRDQVVDVNYKIVAQAYPTYAKYTSLVHFKDVLSNDYRRKLK